MYRFILLAFPRRVRREFGEEMTRMFEAQLRETRAARRSVARLWLLAVIDALVHGTAERLAALGQQGRGLLHELRRWRWWMHAFRQDLRYALRVLVSQPSVTIIAVLTLALGIGANTAIFSAVDTLLLRALPYNDPDSLVMVWEKRHTEGVLDNVVAPADYLDWARLHTSFEHVAGMTSTTADLTGAGEPVRLFAGSVSPAFFEVFGVRPALGRTFRPDEATVGRHRVVILGHPLWEQRFGSDPGVVGRKISLNGIPHDVVGVLPATFEFPDSDLELWTVLALEGGKQPPTRTNHFLNVYGRMKPGITLQQARADMDRVGAALSAQYPESNRNHGAHVSPLSEELTEPFKSGLLLLLGAVAFVLLIACVNVANLLLAKAASRRREMAVRAALGAGRARMAGQALTESLLLGLLGGAAGLLVAHWGIDVLRRLAPANVPLLGLNHIGLDPRVLIFTLMLSIATGLLFGLLPAWHVASQDVNESLKEGGRLGGGIRRRLRVALVVSEIALASLLLVGAGLMLRSFQTLLRAESGFSTDRLLTALIVLPSARYSDDGRVLAGFDEIERRLTSIPGVRSVGGTSHLPLSTQDSRTGVAIEGREPTPDVPTRAHPRAVTIDYFRTMGIPLLEGRNFTAGDHSESQFVIIVNETMAKRYWPGKSPVGKRVLIGGDRVWREVVGLVRDVKHWGLERPANPEMYLPQRQMVFRSLNFVLRTDRDPSSVAGAVREQLRAVDADLPLSNVRTMEEVAARSVASRRAGMMVLGIFGALALVLAAAGIYGVMAHLVALRTPEIGVRMTLGAQPRDVMRLILREGVVQAVIGLAIGLTGAVLLMRGFRAMLYHVSPADPVTLAAVAVILIGTALLACFVPARRAMRVDPVQALRK